MKGLAKVLLSIAAPVVALIAVMLFIERPLPDPPDPPELTDTAEAPDGPPPDGRWEIVSERSFVGYRVPERDLRRGHDTEAVGRTDAVAGEVGVDDGVVVEASADADLSTLESDQRRRDRILQVRFLESEDHPDARFTVTEPFAVADGVPDGRVVTHRVAGMLEVRGIEREVTADLRVRWDGEEIAIVGAVPVELADFGIRTPSIERFRLVEDHGEIEVNLRLRPAD